ncbi:MAG: sulfate adenylyltransferase subunit CysD [Caulobacterales bacterium]
MPTSSITPQRLTHLQHLEAQAIHILREVVAEAANPVFLYSIGKDSSVMLRLALKAFYPASPPFKFLHIASGWDFSDMIAHRDKTAKDLKLDLIVHHNDEAAIAGINPFDTPTKDYTRLMLTEPLKAALTAGAFDAAFGGGRRDEEKSRAKERIFSFRNAAHAWDPRTQRPELWRLYNARTRDGESVRAFPLSNWTELDIWLYILRENIPIVPLYLARPRPTIKRGETLLMVDDARLPLSPGEQVVERSIRFRTLGCYPLSGAIESQASTIEQVIQEVLSAAQSERQGRLIDHDQTASMEHKKREGYF